MILILEGYIVLQDSMMNTISAITATNVIIVLKGPVIRNRHYFVRS